MLIKDRKFKGKFDLIKKSFLYPEIKALRIFRKVQHYSRSKNLIMKFVYNMKWLKMRKAGYQISIDAKIGQGLYLLHHGTRIIVSKSIIGNDCTVGVNVIIGYNLKENEYFAPIIGDRVYIGHNSTIVGKVTIGNDVLIAPNTFVNKDVPSHSIVIGNNQVISKTNASKYFLKIGA